MEQQRPAEQVQLEAKRVEQERSAAGEATMQSNAEALEQQKLEAEAQEVQDKARSLAATAGATAVRGQLLEKQRGRPSQGENKSNSRLRK